MYLTEAFKALNLLEEETFNLSDEGIQKLAEFKLSDDAQDVTQIIDPEADTDEDIQDSYVGKIILDCGVCHSKLYKNKEDIEVNEDQTLANVGEECPFCYTSEGFKILGEVAEYDADDTEEDTDDSVELEEGLKGVQETTEVSVGELKVGDVIVDGEDLLRVKKISPKGSGVTVTFRGTNPNHKGSWEGNVGYHNSKRVKIIAESKSVKEAYQDTDGIMGEKGKKYTSMDLKAYWEKEKNNDPVLKAYNGDFDKWHKETTSSMKPVNEAVNNVTVDTDDSHIEIGSDDSGKVTVTTEPLDNQAGDIEGEVIAPLSDETEAELLSDDSEEDAVDVSIDEVDEETFDDLGESYFRSLDENVVFYKTTNITEIANKLMFEGVVAYKNGSRKKVSLQLEAADATRSGRCRFSARAPRITNESFVVRGKVIRGKFITESVSK